MRARQFTITNVAHDLRQLILRRQDGKPVYVHAVSYGTQLALRALQIGALPVTGLVLDSVVPMETADEWDLSRRSLVVDDVGRQVLAKCDADPQCAAMLGEPAASLYRRVLDANPQRLPRLMGRLLDVPALRARISWLLRDLGAGGNAELARMTSGLSEAGAALGDFDVAALRGAGRIELVEVNGAPHFILWVAPDCFKRQVGAFIAGRALPRAHPACEVH